MRCFVLTEQRLIVLIRNVRVDVEMDVFCVHRNDNKKTRTAELQTATSSMELIVLFLKVFSLVREASVIFFIYAFSRRQAGETRACRKKHPVSRMMKEKSLNTNWNQR